MVTVPEALYVDRKMLKWLPFQSLNAHTDAMNALFSKNEPYQKPPLSSDQYAMMQYRFETALMRGETVQIDYVKGNALHMIEGKIQGADRSANVLLLDSGPIQLDCIIDVR